MSIDYRQSFDINQLVNLDNDSLYHIFVKLNDESLVLVSNISDRLFTVALDAACTRIKRILKLSNVKFDGDDSDDDCIDILNTSNRIISSSEPNPYLDDLSVTDPIVVMYTIIRYHYMLTIDEQLVEATINVNNDNFFKYIYSIYKNQLAFINKADILIIRQDRLELFKFITGIEDTISNNEKLLTTAAKYNSIKIFKYLLSKGQFQPNNIFPYQPLKYAEYNGNQEMIDILTDGMPDDIAIKYDFIGAVYNRDYEMIDAILESGFAIDPYVALDAIVEGNGGYKEIISFLDGRGLGVSRYKGFFKMNGIDV